MRVNSFRKSVNGRIANVADSFPDKPFLRKNAVIVSSCEILARVKECLDAFDRRDASQT